MRRSSIIRVPGIFDTNAIQYERKSDGLNSSQKTI